MARRGPTCGFVAMLAACSGGSDDGGGEGSSGSSSGDTTATSASSSSDSGASSSTSTTSVDGSSDASSSASSTGEPSTGLAIDGFGFTWNGAPIFLIGVSYFDGRDWAAADLDMLEGRGWNLVRIWLDWSDDGYFGPDGALTAEGTAALLALVDDARAREMIVDVTILDPALSFTPDTDHRLAATQSVTTALLGRDNVLFDVMNEHDHGDGPIDHAEAALVVAAVVAIDPARIVTISSTGGHLVNDVAEVQVSAVDEEIDVVGVDVITPHMPRTPDWFSETDTRVASLRAHLRGRGIAMPIYLQEEARRGHSGLDPSEAEFIQAAEEAQAAGAAGWIFHTDAGFELGVGGFFAALDPVEAAVVDNLPAAL